MKLKERLAFLTATEIKTRQIAAKKTAEAAAVAAAAEAAAEVQQTKVTGTREQELMLDGAFLGT